MKTIILSLIFGFISLVGFSQTGYDVTVNGKVTMETGSMPIPFYPVIITTDSLDPDGYYNMVLTDISGNYSDSFVSYQDNGTVYVSVINCNGVLVKEAQYSENDNNITLNFEVCFDSIDGGDDYNDSCFAMFAYATGSSPLEIAFINASFGNPTEFYWDFGDGTSSTEENPLHTYSTAGEYDVTFTISGEECSSSITLPVLAEDNWGDSTGFTCQAMFIPLPEDTNGMAIQFIDQSLTADGGTPDAWYWDFGDGTTSTEQNPLHVYQNEGDYTVCLTISDSGSECESSLCLPVYVFDGGNFNDSCNAFFYYMPVDSIGFDMTNLQFVDLSLGNPTSWSWNFGDGSSSSEQNPIHKYTEEGVYNVCLTITNENQDCQNTFCQEVYAFSGDSTGFDQGYFASTINPDDPLTVMFEAIDLSNCTNQYSWDFGDNTTGTGQTVTHTYAQSGVYTVTLTATASESNCSWSYTDEVWTGDDWNVTTISGKVFLDSLQPTDAAMVYLMGIDTSNCSPMTIDTTVTDENGQYQFSTDILENFILFTQAELSDSSSYYGDYAPTYHLNALNWEDAFPIIPLCDQGPFDIYMIPQESAGQGEGEIFGSVSYSGKDPVVEGIEILLMNQQQNVLSYVKSNEDGSFQFPQLAYGNYKVSAEMIGYSSNIEDVTISETNPSQEISVVVKDGAIVLNINNKPAENSVRISNIYPNPVTNSFNINIYVIEKTDVDITIVNQAGQTVYTDRFITNKGLNRFSAYVNELPQGVYILKLKTFDGNILSTQKLVKLR